LLLLFFYFIVFNQKKKWGRRYRILFSFDSFLDIMCFLPDISVHCSLIEYAYI
jgi:hypothetical protein